MRNRRISARRRMRRGMALAMTMLLMLGVIVIGVVGMIATPKGSANNGLMTSGTNAMQLSNMRLQSGTAFNMAEAGLHYTLQWISSLPAPPPNTAAFGPRFQWNTLTYNSTATTVTPDPAAPSNRFKVTVYPDATNYNNPDKSYLIESTGTGGGVSQTVQMYIAVSSLSKWLVLVNQWPANNYWVSGLSSFDGPVHDNNADSSGNNPGTGQNEDVFWMSNATTPMWSYSGSDAYEVSGNVNWYKNNWFSPGAPQTDADWATILAGGKTTFTHGAAPVRFPKNSLLQQYAALGQAMPAGTTTPPAGAPGGQSPTGVTVTPGGGIYIHCAKSQDDTQGTPPVINNDVQQMTLSVDASGNQVITVLQTDDNGNPLTTKLTMDVAAKATQVEVDALVQSGKSGNFHPSTTNTSVAGLTNGVVYCDGNIGTQGTAPGDPVNGTAKAGGLSGTVANRAYDASGNMTYTGNLNITTDSTKNCNIDGSLTYKTARQKNADGTYVPESQDANFTQYAGTLGLVSNTVLLTTKDANGNALNTVEVDGAILAYHLYEVDRYYTRPAGNWENMGGYLSANMGVFGVGDQYGNLLAGMNNTFNYDTRMRNTPPPFFPTSGAYSVLSWRRVPTTLE